MSNSSDTTPYSYSPQGYPSFGLLSSMTFVESQGSLCPGSPGRNINASVQSARAEPYPSCTPSSPRTSLWRSCVPIEEEEEEDSTSMEPQSGLFPVTPRRDISASMSNPQTGPYLSCTPSSPSTSFIRCLGTLAEEEDDDDDDEWTSMEPQSSLFSGYDINASVPLPSAQAGPHLNRTPSSPSTSFIRRLCTLIEVGEEE
jgi:hypothetical protein